MTPRERQGAGASGALCPRDRADRTADRARDEGQGAAGGLDRAGRGSAGRLEQGLRLCRSREEAPATADTVYRVGSVSKLFTDIAVMQLVERGEVDLDAPVTTYLPDFKPTNPFGTPITLRQLMSHRAGLVREPPVGNYFDDTRADRSAQTVASLNRTTLVYAPGNAHQVLQRRHRRRRPRARGGREAAVRRCAAATRAGAAGSQKERVRADARGDAGSRAGVHVDVSRPRFAAPTFQLGMAPAGSMYSTVTDLGRFLSALFNRVGRERVRPEARDARGDVDAAVRAAGAAHRLRPRLRRRRLRRAAARRPRRRDLRLRDRAAALPDSKLGVVVVDDARLRQPVMTHIADEALRAMLRARDKQPVPDLVLPTAVPRTGGTRRSRMASAKRRTTGAHRAATSAAPRLLASLAKHPRPT